MNDTATAGGASGASLIPDTTGAFTIAHLAVIALFAIAVIVAIVWGARLKRQRKAAEREIASHNAEVAAPPEPTPAPAPAPAPRVVPAAPAAPVQPVTPPAPAEAIAAPDPIANEPIAAAAPLDAAPAMEAASAPADSPADAPVGTLKGLGPKLAARLGELGITTVGQIAALTDDEAARLDAQLGPFSGRIARDRWIEQARFLAAGDRAGFEAVFGRL